MLPQDYSAWIKTHNIKSQDRHDANLARVSAVSAVFGEAKKRLIGDVYGKRHIHLMILATLRAYRGRGAGRKLIEWGLELARQHGVAVSVFGTSVGARLYSFMGFRLLDKVTVQIDDEEEMVESSALIWDSEVESARVES
jgi:GNAT superfamily N-acetyltransferase